MDPARSAALTFCIILLVQVVILTASCTEESIVWWRCGGHVFPNKPRQMVVIGNFGMTC